MDRRVRTMDRRGSITQRYGVELLVGVAAVASALEVSLRHDAAHQPRSSLWFATPAIVVVVLPLLGRRRFPFAAPAGLWLLATAVSFVDGRLVVFPIGAYLAGMVAAYLLGSIPDPREAKLGLAVVLGGSVVVVHNDPGHPLGQLILIPVVFGIAWAAGFALKEPAARAEAAERRAAHAERERETSARIAVAEERARIARELHDIVAHAVSVMVLQVGAVRLHLPDEQGEQVRALADVEQTGRTALADMRHLLGSMRDDGDDNRLSPQPGVDRLEGLVQGIGAVGPRVHMRVDGHKVALPGGIDVSAYRIVQEGLTNALKHAHASEVQVRLHFAENELRIEVRDDGRGREGTNGDGHGLIGVRERVTLYGGSMSAGSLGDGGFLLTASLPLP